MGHLAEHAATALLGEALEEPGPDRLLRVDAEDHVSGQLERVPLAGATADANDQAAALVVIGAESDLAGFLVALQCLHGKGAVVRLGDAHAHLAGPSQDNV